MRFLLPLIFSSLLIQVSYEDTKPKQAMDKYDPFDPFYTDDPFYLVSETPAPWNAPRECGCTLKNLWLDIVLVLDSSNGVSAKDFSALRALLIGFIMQIDVSQREGMYSRVAIVNVAKNAVRIANLTSFNSNSEAVAALSQLQFQGESSFNLGAGLIEAQKILDEAGNRANAKNLVIVFASTGIDCSMDQSTKRVSKASDEEPCRIAAHMVEDTNTELMTVALKFPEDPEFPALNFGSPCYSTVNDLDLMSNIIRLACKANCFCQRGYTQFKTDEDCHSYGECVYLKGVPAAYFAAQVGCQLDNTTLADVQSEAKETFLREIAVQDGQIPYWIGLQYSYYGSMWDTGKELFFGDYTHWASGEPSKQGCVYVKRSRGFATEWFTDECSWGLPSYYYFCQKNTCDTDNYCA